jgi:hypothetical protein
VVQGVNRLKKIRKTEMSTDKITDLDPIDLDLLIAKNTFQTAWLDDDTGNVHAFDTMPTQEIEDFSPQIYETQAYQLAYALDIQILVKFKKSESGEFGKLYLATKWLDTGTVIGHMNKDPKRAISLVAGEYFQKKDKG